MKRLLHLKSLVYASKPAASVGTNALNDVAALAIVALRVGIATRRSERGYGRNARRFARAFRHLDADCVYRSSRRPAGAGSRRKTFSWIASSFEADAKTKKRFARSRTRYPTSRIEIFSCVAQPKPSIVTRMQRRWISYFTSTITIRRSCVCEHIHKCSTFMA